MSTHETTRPDRGFQFKIQTLLIATFAFALGMVAKNMVSGLHPFAERRQPIAWGERAEHQRVLM